MDENRKPENDSLSKKHFAKFHERVQNKYVAMQKKLEKSRSVDSISSLSDNSSFRHSRGSTNSDIRDDEVFEAKSDAKIFKHSVILEDINKRDATLKDYEVEPVYESVITPPIDLTNHEYENNDPMVFFSDDWNLSLESIYDACKDKPADENRQPKPNDDVQANFPTKMSLRYRIKERLSAARERRKEAKEKKKENIDQLLLSTNKLDDLHNTLKDNHTKKKNKIASVAVAIIDASWPENETQDKAAEENPKQLLHCRIRLGSEKRKSKMAKIVGNKRTWQELFNISLYDKYLLEVTVWDRDTFIGRCSIDLKTLEEETTHRIQLNLEECATQVQLFMIITISGTLNNLILDSEDENQTVVEDYNEYIRSIGWLNVEVFRATGLPELSDKCCVIELVNDRKQTQTEFKTGEPQWMKQFSFDVKDVTSILSIKVMEEKKTGMVVIGILMVPLLSIENDVKRWYSLKDSTLTTAAKGTNPKILLKMTLVFSSVKAALRVLSPKEDLEIKKIPEFDRRVFSANVLRAKVIISWVYDAIKLSKALFEWNNAIKNFLSLVVWISFWWMFKQWMLPLFLLLPFIFYSQNALWSQFCKIFEPIFNWINKFDSDSSTLSDNGQDTLGTGKTSSRAVPKAFAKKEESRSLLQRVRSLTDIILTAQTDIGKFASFGESVKNLYNFSVPFLSFLTIQLIIVITLVMVFIPIRYILIIWAIWKYFRKLLFPNRIPNSEILDLLSRVPDDETLLYCQELPLIETVNKERRDSKLSS